MAEQDQVAKEETPGTDDIICENKEKSGRHRKRNFYNAIREQMEFYFGDANLSKDRYLMQLIRQDKFVPLDVFLKFNKVKKLVDSVKDIATALSNSKVLHLNSDKTCVCRLLPIVENRDADHKTIYVEGLPPSADHEWVKKVFTQVTGGGAVAYVSLPKYKKTRKIKEFGFVEFENESSVEKCIKSFLEFDGVLSSPHFDPAQLTSITTYILEQDEADEDDDDDEVESKENDKNEANEKTAQTNESESDSDGSSSENDEPQKKRIKKSSDTVDEVDQAAQGTDVGERKDDGETESGDKGEVKDKDGKDKGEGVAENDTKITKDANPADEKTADEPKKKSRSRKKLNKNRKLQKLNMESDFRQLRILQKKDWKRLRNKYLNMQRDVIVDLKRKAWERKEAKAKNKANANQAANQKPKEANSQMAATSSASIIPNIQKFEIIKSPHHMNFYGTGDDKIDSPSDSKRRKIEPVDSQLNENKPLNIAAQKPPAFRFATGVIVNVVFLEPCVDIKAFKSDMRQYDYVKYIDIKEGAMEANVRCASNEFAHQFCQKIQSAEMNCKIIEGEQEQKYWNKMVHDREMKLNKAVKIKSKRGREKIVKIVAEAKHLRFGDDDE